MKLLYILHNIDVDESVSKSITEDSQRVNGKFIITIIGKKWFITSLYTYSLKNRYFQIKSILNVLYFFNCSHIIYTLMYMLYDYYFSK